MYKTVFLEIQNVTLWSVLPNTVTNRDVDRLYVPCLMGGRRLLSVANVVACECNGLHAYVSNSSNCHLQPLLDQPWFQKFDCHLSRKECAKRHLEAWQNKSLHGQFYRQVAGTVDTRWQWCCLKQGNLPSQRN